MSQDGMRRRTFALASVAGAVSIAVGAEAATAGAPEAKTRQGRVRGFRRNGAEIFLGLPYGADTSGERRFMPPAPPSSWSDVRDATKLGQRAPQLGGAIYESPQIGEYMAGGRAAELKALREPMGEDCLVLNVLTPKADKRGRPVMVYLHGGGFDSGSGAVHTVGDRFVAEEDLVLVTVNHRLSALGFLYAGGSATANVGLLDIVAALQWVRDNIAEFGGDPDKVTIFGESGGGAKVSFMLSMPQAQGLFRAAIIQSAGLVSPAKAPDILDASSKLLAKLSAAPNNLAPARSVAATEVLKSIPAGSRFGPVLDGAVITRGPWQDGPPPGAANIPIIVGSCSDEATLFLGQSDLSLYSLTWPDVATRLATLAKKPADSFGPSIEAYRKVYPRESATDVFFRMASVSFLGWNTRKIADLKATQRAPVYLYRMEYDTGIPPGLRAFHTCELPLANRMVWQPRAEQLSKQIAGAWAAFARTGGNPIHAGLPQWSAYRGGNDAAMMLFNLQTRAGADPSAAAEATLRDALGGPSFA